MLSYFRTPKKILKKILIGLSLFFIGTTAAYLFSALLKKITSYPFVQNPAFPFLTMTLVCLIFYKPIERAITYFIEHYIFKKKSYAHLTLMDLANDLTLNMDLRELANLVVNTFGEVLHLKTVALLVGDEKEHDFRIASAFGWQASAVRQLRLSSRTPLMRIMKENGAHVIVRGPMLRSLSWQEANQLVHDFDLLRAEWIIPLLVKEDVVGLIVFGSHYPDRVFDQSDFEFFREFAGKIAGCVYNAMYVKKLKSLNEELQDSQAHRVQTTKLTAIKQLAAGISHEIHNPLAIISGKAQVLLMQKRDGEKMESHIEEALKIIVKQTKRAADITRKLLMYSKETTGPIEALELDKVLNDTIALIAYQSSLDNIEISKIIDSKLPPYNANVQEIREIFLNLLLNAIESVGSCGKVEIKIEYHSKDELIEIRFTDNGKGIGLETLDKLFDPFFTTRHEAVGLGLFVTRQIIHRYGGSIRVESRVDEGSLFIVQLPCKSFLEQESLDKGKKSLLLHTEGI